MPKAEPGKPLYARKPTARGGRPLIEKRYAEGERKLHPVRPRSGAGPGGRATTVQPVEAVKREPREVTVTEGITVRELAENGQFFKAGLYVVLSVVIGFAAAFGGAYIARNL